MAIARKSEIFKRSCPQLPCDALYCQDIPLPNAIKRHIENPNLSLLQGSALGKITGFRIEAKGRKGSRSQTQVVHYGKLGRGDIAKSCVDFGKSFYVHKKGVTGIKVTIGYS
jgi:hypothetical protein